MAQERYDQRVSALVEVRGGPHDWEEAERRFDVHGWPVRGRHRRGEGPTRGVLDPDPDARVYEVEVRLFGAARGCDRGAFHRLRKVMRAARLEAYVLRVEPLVRDREDLTLWRVVRTSYRRPRPTSPLRRSVGRYALRLGRYDTGALVLGGPSQALRLARADAGTGYAGPAPVAVRPLDGRWRANVRYWPEEEGERRLFRMSFCALATAVFTVFAAGGEGLARWFWSALVALGAVATLWSGARLYRTGRVAGGVIGAVALGAFTAIALGVLDAEGRGWTRLQVFVTVVVVAVLGGLRLLVRQWTWGEWVVWAVPLVATLAASSFLAAGSLLHALYADGLDLSPDDLDVPAIWQAAAAVKLLILLSVVAVVPAWWGYARHRHHFYATPGDGFNVVMYVLLLVVLLSGAAALALDSAGTAVGRTVTAARNGEEPPPYFGVRPGWACVEPAVPAARLAGEGPRLDPARPYLSFGTTDGTAILWDRTAEEPLRLPASQVRLVPTRSAAEKCRTAAP